MLLGEVTILTEVDVNFISEQQHAVKRLHTIGLVAYIKFMLTVHIPIVIRIEVIDGDEVTTHPQS